MTISSSLNSGVSGLMVNANRLATISDNIANSGTYGYKRVVADFHSMVVQQGGGGYSAGGVRSTTQRFIDQRGTLISTNNPTDLAIGGRGLLPVTTGIGATGGGNMPIMLTTTGSFRPDTEGVLRTQTGEVLLGWPADPDGTVPSFPRDTFDGLEPVAINTNQFVSNPTTRMDLSVNLPATATDAGADGQGQVMLVEYFDNMGTSQSLELTYTPTVPAAGRSNEWTVDIRDSGSADAVVASYTLTFDDTGADSGTLAGVTVNSGGAYDGTAGTLAVAVAGGQIDIRIGSPGSGSLVTQLSDNFARAPVVKNGSPIGNLDRVEIDEAGMVHAIYDTGTTRVIYQIPVVDVANINGLTAGDNQTYTMSAESGAMYLWDAGDGPTGEMVGYAREESATDVAAELTQLIQTQRAYSSNAKIIQTVDEMLQETTNIKR